MCKYLTIKYIISNVLINKKKVIIKAKYFISISTGTYFVLKFHMDYKINSLSSGTSSLVLNYKPKLVLNNFFIIIKN